MFRLYDLLDVTPGGRAVLNKFLYGKASPRGLYSPRNDPQPWNDPQIDPEMIPISLHVDPEMIPN